MFSLTVLRFFVVVIMPAYRTTAFLFAIKVQAGPSYYLPYDFSLSFPYVLAPRTIPTISPFFPTFLRLVPSSIRTVWPV